MLTNLHTHTTFCDGKNTPEEMIKAAIAKGFRVLGFTSHSDMLADPKAYREEIHRLAELYADKLWIFCGLELELAKPVQADALQGYDYLIGSHHFVTAPDDGFFAFDHTPEILAEGIRDHFDGDAAAFVKHYYAALRSTLSLDFQVVGHADLVRKFNRKAPYFDESAAWYMGELEATADAIAKSGKTVEVNTGAISRGWLDDAYPSKPFRDLLRARRVKFILSSDAHSADTLDCAFDRFASAETFAPLF